MPLLTQEQTVEIYFPNDFSIHYGMEQAPVTPEWVKESEEHEAIDCGEFAVIFWKSGISDVFYSDGQIKRFWPKPTIAEAIMGEMNCGTYAEKAPSGSATYTRFHRNGSVEQKIGGVPYYWGPTNVSAEAPEGKPLYPIIERCEKPEPFAYYSIFSEKIAFNILPGSYLESRPCDCSECYFEGRQRLYRRQNAVACTCIECRDED